MELVRLPLLTRDFLVNNVETEPIIRGSPECKDFLIEALKYHLLPEQRASMQTPRTKERHNSACVPMLFSIGRVAIEIKTEFTALEITLGTNIDKITLGTHSDCHGALCFCCGVLYKVPIKVYIFLIVVPLTPRKIAMPLQE